MSGSRSVSDRREREELFGFSGLQTPKMHCTHPPPTSIRAISGANYSVSGYVEKRNMREVYAQTHTHTNFKLGGVAPPADSLLPSGFNLTHIT